MTCRPDRSDPQPGVQNPRTSAPERSAGAGASGTLSGLRLKSRKGLPSVARGAAGCRIPAVPHSSSSDYPLALQSWSRTVENEQASSRYTTPSTRMGCADAFEQPTTEGYEMDTNGTPVPWDPAPGVPLHKPGIYRSAGEAVATLSMGLAIVLSPTAFLWALWEVVS